MPSRPQQPGTESSQDFQNRLTMFEGSGEFPIPMIRYVQVQTHAYCNADCVFCPYVESWHAHHPGRMSEALWQKILRELAPFASGLNQGKFLPYLMQEPLIDPTIFEKIREIYTHFPGTCVELSTNGMALTPKVIEQLIPIFSDPQHKHQLWISHHGINQQTYEHIMQLDYAHAYSNLIALLRQSEGRMNIRLRGMGERRDGKVLFFSKSEYHRYWQDNFERHELNPKNIQIDAYSFHDRAGTLRREDRQANRLNMETFREIGPRHRFYCPRIDLWLHILWNGQVRLCCMDYHGEITLPNLKDCSITEYFQSEAYRQIYDQVTGKIKSENNLICKRCSSPGG